MEKAVSGRLLEVNRQFYTRFGDSFSVTRRRVQPGVRQVVDRLNGEESILDLGCGNGELARLLVRRSHRGFYLGLDFSRPLLRGAEGLPDEFLFLEADLLGDWESRLAAVLGMQNGVTVNDLFDLVTAFAVLHHVPAHENRLNIVKKVYSLLTPCGRFIHSNWQFLNSPRLRDRIQPWERIGLSRADVDENDYLLDWRRDGEGLRYVHHFNPQELERLAREGGFHMVETYSSDGENNSLGLYQIWEKGSCSQPSPVK